MRRSAVPPQPMPRPAARRPAGPHGPLACSLIAGVSFLSVSCLSAPSGFVPAAPADAAAFSTFLGAFSAGCAARLDGSFLAEARVEASSATPEGGGAVGFQMEGAWRDGARGFEAQLLSPVGEALATFTLDGSGTRATFPSSLPTEARVRLGAFVDLFATLGPEGLRRLACGSGLLSLEDATLYVPVSKDSRSPEPLLADPDDARAAWITRGVLRVGGHDVTLVSRVSRGADVAIESSTRAGLFRSSLGTIRWRGTVDTDAGSARPRALAFASTPSPTKRPGSARETSTSEEGAASGPASLELTFLEFE